MSLYFVYGGFESRLLAMCRWHIATGVAFPQKSESTTEGRQGRQTAENTAMNRPASSKTGDFPALQSARTMLK